MDTSKILKLKEKMEDLSRVSEKLTEHKVTYEKSIKGLKDLSGKITVEISAVKAELEIEAKAEYKEHGIKKLLGGIGIQIKKTMTYDPDKAFKFAKEKDMFLTLDKKAFEKSAASLNLEFVTTGTAVKVTFPPKIVLEA